jgi:Ca-activated chloride channel homolog
MEDPMGSPISPPARRASGLAVVLLLTLTTVAATPVTSAPATGRIEGRVRDQAGAPIANAQVFVVGTALNTITDNSGHYRFSSVAEGQVTLRAAFIGYKSAEAMVQVRRDRTVTRDFILEAAPTQLQEITTVQKAAPPEGRPFNDALPLEARDEVGSKRAARALTRGAEKARIATGAVSSGVALATPEPWRWAREPGNTEAYNRIEEGRFLEAAANPLSTFSIDVDAASYSNARRFLSQGALPPPDAVRLEEFVNYFSYHYPDPSGEHPFAVAAEVADCPWQADHRLVRIGLQGKRLKTRDLPPSNLVFLIDVSGSMMSEDKLPLVKRAFRALVGELRQQDRVAMVVYAGAAGLVLPSTSGAEKSTILSAIDRLEAGGSTAGGAGLRLAYDVAKEHYLSEGNNRVILATDGDFNVGVSSDAEMIRLVEARRTEGTFLTVLGFGRGNLKDSKMEQMADKGNGHYAYIDNFREAQKVFVREFGGTLFTIAKDVKIQVEFNPARVQAYRLLGYENRMLAKEDFADDRKDAGELGAGHSVTALYEVVPVGARPVALAGDSLRYQETTLRPSASHSEELLTVRLRYKAPNGNTSRLLSTPLVDREGAEGSEDMRWATAVAGFALLLRDSEYKGSLSYERVLEIARGARGDDEEGYRGEFIGLVEAARSLAVATTD